MAKGKGSRATLPSHYAGVPVGGVGTGCIELGADARFRNVTINNNRTAATRIPFASGAFLAVRAARGKDVSTRILQPETSIPFEAAGILAPYTSSAEMSWYGLYPGANYRLAPECFPLELQWSCLAPVIPYDTQASTLPLIMCALQFTNPTEETFSISALFNWENLRGCTADESPEDRGLIRAVSYRRIDETLHVGDAGTENDEMPALPLGLSFGHWEPCAGNADGNYCLVATPADGMRTTHAGWHRKSEGDIRKIWESFEESGALPGTISSDPEAHCGSVCTSVRLAPGETRRLLFLLTWYCPYYVVEGRDLGNGYAAEYESAVHVAEYSLKHSGYFLRAVSSWHNRFLQSSFPNWYTRMLINNSHVFTTNSILTRDGQFAMMETPQDPVMGVLDRSFYSSIGTLLFFPGFAERELELFGQTDTESAPGRIYRELGNGTIYKPGYGGVPDEMTDLNAKFILMAYRNFHLTGKTVTLINIFPRLREAMEYSMRGDDDRDGIPDVHGDATTFRGWEMHGLSSYTGGLWIDAMLAYAKMARHLKHEQEARFYEARARRALRYFERRLWNDEEGYYRLYIEHEPGSADPSRSDDGCLSGQLAGAWYADFLNIEAGFSHERIGRALESIERLDQRPGGIAKGYAPDGTPCRNPPGSASDPDAGECWPSYTVSYLACPQIYHGSVDKGLEMIRSVYQNLHVKHQRTYNQPLAWDAERDEPCGSKQDRHMGALSIWHSLYALQGFSLSVPEQTIRIAPRLPEGVHHLSTPLFTPLTFGWLTYQVTLGPPYRQELRITFESPMFIRVIELAVPKSLRHPNVRLLINEDPAALEAKLVSHEPENRLLITLEMPLHVQHPIEIIVE